MVSACCSCRDDGGRSPLHWAAVAGLDSAAAALMAMASAARDRIAAAMLLDAEAEGGAGADSVARLPTLAEGQVCAISVGMDLFEIHRLSRQPGVLFVVQRGPALGWYLESLSVCQCAHNWPQEYMGCLDWCSS